MKDPGLAGIAALLRGNQGFRRLWYGQLVSQLGDWFNHVAVITLLLELTGSGEMVGWSLILRMLPAVVVAPIAGVFVDRWDRKKIMIAADVLRGLTVPLFLLVRDPSFVPMIYALVVAQVVLSSFFEPARQAAVPSLVSKDELLSANALMSVTWSIMLALGSALGGLVIGTLGLEAAWVLDAATFFVSASFLARLDLPRRAPRPRPSGSAWARGFVEMVDGFKTIVNDPSILSLVLVKTGVGLAGGMVLLLSVFGERVFPVGASASVGIGLLFAARGVGTAIGPFIGRAISGYHEPTMRRLIGFGFLQASLFIVLFALSGDLLIALPLLLIAHIGTSIDWVFSTVLLQLKVADDYRGRVFSAEMALFTLVFSLATWLTGYALDELGWSPRLLAVLCGLALAVPGVIWTGLAARRRARGES